MDISRERRGEIIAALRKGTVPQRGLDFLAVGLGRFESAIAQEMANVAQGGAIFKAVRLESSEAVACLRLASCMKTSASACIRARGSSSGAAMGSIVVSTVSKALISSPGLSGTRRIFPATGAATT